ncbi:MAG: VOC family protein [Phycisphaeraceae bacterium]|nr:VOC family protein [Phycisphaeraceae bacterium]
MSLALNVVSLFACSLLVGACASSGSASPSSDPANPLSDAGMMGFVATSDAPRSRAFYEGKLGMRVLEDDPMAIMLRHDSGILRIQKANSFQPQRFTVLGWRVHDLRTTVHRLKNAGVAIERYPGMSFQDDDGIATFSSGAMVAWFKDPDGNILSVAQFTEF